MSFAAPLVLLALLGAARCCVVWYVAQQRDRGAPRPRVRRAGAARLGRAAPPGWRRHVPMLAFAARARACSSSRPRSRRGRSRCRSSARRSCSRPTSRGSMQATDVKPSRLVAARARGASASSTSVPRGVNVGVMAFNQHAARAAEPDAATATTIDAALDRLTPSGGTATGEAIQRRAAHPAPARRAMNGKPPAGRDRAALRRRLDDAASDPIAAAQARASAQDPRLHRRARHRRRARSPSRAPAGRRHRDAPRPARPAALAADRARPRAARPSPPPTPSELKRRLRAARLAARAPRTSKRQVTAASPAAPSCCCCSAPAMSLRWFGRLI